MKTKTVLKTAISRRPRRQAAALFWASIFWASLVAAHSTAAELLSGPELVRRLRSPVGAHWDGRPLGGALATIAEEHQLATFLDRRVDPGRKVKFAFRDVELREGLELLAAHEKLGVALLGPVAYFGPPDTVDKLRTLAAIKKEEFKRLSAAARRRLRRARPLAWDRLSSPRDLVVRIAESYHLALANPDAIPHDLWPEGRLPPLTAAEQLSLVLFGFDLTFEIDAAGEAVKVVPLPETIALDRRYDAGSDADHRAKILKKVAPGAKMKIQGGEILIRGLLEDHERIKAALSGKPVRRRRVKTPPKGEERYTLNVKNVPVKKLVDTLAKQLKLYITYDRAAIDAAGIDLSQKVEVKVKDGTAEELLAAALSPAGLRFRREGDIVTIVPAK